MNDLSQDSLRGSALAKSLAVLKVVAAGSGPVSLAEIARELDMPRQTAHRLTGQLLETGLLQRDPEKDHYLVGHRAIDIGLATLQAGARIAPVDAIMRRLVADINETCNLGVMDRSQVLYIHRVECDWPLRMQLAAGSHVSLHATAMGKLFLAWLPKRIRQRLIAGPLERYTENTITDRSALEDQFQLIRSRGYSLNHEENMTGLIGIAVPIPDAEGRPLAALSVHAPVFRLPLGRAQEHFQRLKIAAEDLSECYRISETDEET
ncbi:MAG: IclR family transcriptional regulator [Rhodospirillales bacterium]